MKVCSTSDRLKQIMEARGLRQVDILDAAKPFCEKHKVKLGKNDLSQYVSGKVEPGHDKLSILSMALNVSEAWLMGYDVPLRSRLTIGNMINKTIAHNIQLHRKEANLTQKQLADMLCIDECFVVGLESGQIPLEKEMLYKICDALHLIPSNFLSRDDEELTEDEEYLLSRREKENAPTVSGERSVSDDDIKFALFGGSGEITDAMYQEVKEFAALVKLREDMKKSKE